MMLDATWPAMTITLLVNHEKSHLVKTYQLLYTNDFGKWINHHPNLKTLKRRKNTTSQLASGVSS